MSALPWNGGCLCGSIRYRISLAPLDAGYCHCGLCRRSAGVPVVAWATVVNEGFAFTRGQPVSYASSPAGQRQFCGRCGTQLTFQYTPTPKTIDFTLGSLDDPGLVKPQYHIWRGNKIDWFETSDTLPRHLDRGPDQWT